MIRTNYGKSSIKFMGPTVWNQIDEKLKNLSLKSFQQKMKESLLETYANTELSQTLFFPFLRFFLFFFVTLTYFLLSLLPATVI